MDLAWKLICFYSEAPDIRAIFKTCKVLSVLSQKADLWSYLMQRDFPEHYKLSKPFQHKEWYQDLYTYGAYFRVTDIVEIYPNQFLYSGCKYKGDRAYTVRKRDPWKDFSIRLPGQLYTRLSEITDITEEDLPTVLSNHQTATIVESSHSYLGLLLLRGSDLCFCNNIASLTKIEKCDYSPWANLILWIHTHFNLKRISMIDTQDLIFQGTLRDGHFFGSVNPKHPLRNQATEISSKMWEENASYRIVRKIGLKSRQEYRTVSLPNGSAFDTINNQVIPAFDEK
jgi:hypothetical protein